MARYIVASFQDKVTSKSSLRLVKIQTHMEKLQDALLVYIRLKSWLNSVADDLID